MPSESTPLISTVRIAPARQRYPHQTIRRFFTIACSAILVFGFIFVAIHALIIEPLHFHHGKGAGKGKSLAYGELKKILLETPSSEHAREWSKYYTAGPHLAGKNYSQAEWTMEKWEEWGVKSHIEAYDVYINYPKDHSLRLLEKKKGKKDGDAESWKVSFKASLTEDVLDDDPTTSLKDRIPTFHGYSASGNVTGSLVYANYGTYRDYQDLVDAGVELKGKIAIVRYGGVFRGLKVKRAQELGMLGCIIYSDPGDDGEMTEENGYEAYPEGPARNPSSVQRGSVQFLSTRPGDPTTPGYPSKPGVPRAPANESTPSIPSIPISYADAIPLLKALNGHGPKSKEFNWFWNRNLGLGYKGVDYNIGPTPDDVVVNLFNEQDYETTPQWDVIGIVNGSIPNDVIIIGNHRDAWIAGGAGDPNSGSAAINEVVRSVGKALEAGWKPLRTIIFASWDGEEYGLVGSTEWVEEYAPWLAGANLAYINVDVAATGPVFGVSAAPLLNDILRETLHEVQSPNQTVKHQTVGDVWDGKIGTMGSGSDFTAFQDYIGVPSLDMSFTAGPNSPVYHYHSNYDSFHWMDTLADPGFKYHKAMAQIVNVMLAKLSEKITHPFRAGEYADALDSYLDKVEAHLNSDASAATEGKMSDDEMFALRGSILPIDDVTGNADAFRESIKTVRSRIGDLRVKAYEVDELADWASEALEEGIPWWNIVRKYRVFKAIIRANKGYKLMERSFLFEGGLDGRSWFKHVVFAPGLWTGYAGAVYPGLMEAIDAKDYSNGLKWAEIVQKCVEKATKVLG